MDGSKYLQKLKHDFEMATSQLVMPGYPALFEEELSEYFPFSEPIVDLLEKLYQSEKYISLKPSAMSYYLEEEHPFLFLRDLAHINSWNLGLYNKKRLDHIAGLMFSLEPVYAQEATLAICRPSLIDHEVSQWFDFKQAMKLLDVLPNDDVLLQAWKGCANYYLYFQLSKGHPVLGEDLQTLLEPYVTALEIAMHHGRDDLKSESELVMRSLRQTPNVTLVDSLCP